MDKNSSYLVEMPVGCPAKVFVPLYAGELRKKLASCLALRTDQIRIENQTKEKYSISLLQGALSGMQVNVGKAFSLGSDGLKVTVGVRPYSKTEDLVLKFVQLVWLVLVFPTFFFVVPFVRFIILSLILAVLLLAPVMLTIRAVIRLFMSAVYSAVGNEFDYQRVAALLAVLKQVPLPDPLAALRSAATASQI